MRLPLGEGVEHRDAGGSRGLAVVAAALDGAVWAEDECAAVVARIMEFAPEAGDQCPRAIFGVNPRQDGDES